MTVSVLEVKLIRYWKNEIALTIAPGWCLQPRISGLDGVRSENEILTFSTRHLHPTSGTALRKVPVPQKSLKTSIVWGTHVPVLFSASL